jgi:hypothetical protein
MKVSVSTRSGRTRIEDLEKYVAMNRDANLVKLEGDPDPSMEYRPGHVCGIEEDDPGVFNVYVGSHLIGQLPDEAITFAESVNIDPAFMPAVVGKVDPDGSVYIYVAE